MAGLRERQKAKRHRAIIQAASTLFKQNGYEAARIEAIAEAAEVSVGTFYNYFEHKADLLLAIVSMEVEEVLHQGEGVVAAPPGDAYDAICALVATYYDHSLVYLTKEMWRIAMAFSIQSPDTPFSRRYRDLDHQLSEQVVALMLRLQHGGLVRREVDARAFGELTFLGLNGLFTTYTVTEGMALDELKAAMFRQIRALTAQIAAPGGD